MRQMQDEVDRWFGRMGFDRGWTSPSTWLSRAGEQMGDWMPAIDAFQRGNEFVIRADVPGMTRTDLSVEIGDEAVTIRGERKHEQNEDREGVFWSERSYGSFSRVVPLPPGAISDSAKATFTNGVLEVVVQSPSQDASRRQEDRYFGTRRTDAQGEILGRRRRGRFDCIDDGRRIGRRLLPHRPATRYRTPVAPASGGGGGSVFAAASRRRNSRSTRLGVLALGFHPRRSTVSSICCRPKASAS